MAVLPDIAQIGDNLAGLADGVTVSFSTSTTNSPTRAGCCLMA
jgi:hypothetical protein